MQPVERAEFEGIDYGWVMQTTFVLTILIGAPVVAVLSAFVTLDSWGARAAFAVRVGAPIWFTTAVAVALYARRTDAGDGGVESAGAEEAGGDAPDDTENEGTREDDHDDIEGDENDDTGSEAPEATTGREDDRASRSTGPSKD
ncbi:DUF5822 domain-containing protein [Halorubrum sp. Boch-26]|uniref:DUF5822 domain-containing protein n=1 Tax=Halorubrum sp. Boch-26 TaxID=2994426 RepID=UPI002469651C|nr:DUF5822 domain-containing protein [Halorubrum sp. Boch-26]